jgi:hypothetical protein
MEQLQLNNGGHPLKNDNLKHLQDSVLTLASALGIGLGSNFIVHGAVAGTGSNANTAVLSAGAIYLAGELLTVDAATYTKTSGQVFVWERYDDPLPIDPQTNLNGNQVTVHHVYKARLRAQPAVGGDFAFGAGPRLANKIGDLLKALNTTTPIDFLANWSFYAPASSSVDVTVDVLGNVQVSGAVVNTSAAGSQVGILLPKPQRQMYFTLPRLNAAGHVTVLLTVLGIVTVVSYVPGTIYAFDLSGISYRAV